MKETREADFYPGFQIKLVANLEKVRVPFKMDVTTGDSIYPEVDTHYHQLMFEDKKVEIPAYPTEQIIAEKLSATFSFGTDNSRAKDYYDLFTIPKLENIDTKELYKSVRNTFTKRGDTKPLSFYYEREMDRSGETTIWKSSGKNIAELTRLRIPFHLQIQSTKLIT